MELMDLLAKTARLLFEQRVCLPGFYMARLKLSEFPMTCMRPEPETAVPESCNRTNSDTVLAQSGDSGLDHKL